MSHRSTARKGLTAVAAIGVLALGGSAIAGAAGNGTSSATTTTATTTPGAAQGNGGPPPGGQRRDPTRPGGHRANGKTEKALSSDVAAKVKAAAEAKIPGGTVLRVETDADHGSPYEAHVSKSDGSEVEVLVDSDFDVTAVNAMGPR